MHLSGRQMMATASTKCNTSKCPIASKTQGIGGLRLLTFHSTAGVSNLGNQGLQLPQFTSQPQWLGNAGSRSPQIILVPPMLPKFLPQLLYVLGGCFKRPAIGLLVFAKLGYFHRHFITLMRESSRRNHTPSSIGRANSMKSARKLTSQALIMLPNLVKKNLQEKNPAQQVPRTNISTLNYIYSLGCGWVR